MTILYERPKPQSFARTEESTLASTLATIDRNTTVLPVTRMDELRLTRDGRTVHGGYRYSAKAFRLICYQLASGLGNLLPDISGTKLRGLHDRYIDGVAAVNIFNQILELRFGALHSLRLVRNEATRSIDGCVGSGHRWLENSQMFQQANEHFGRRGVECRFHGAMLLGRQLMLWYRRNEPFFSTVIEAKPWRLYTGYYLRNEESRDVSICACAAVFSRLGTCRGPIRLYGSSLRHSGRDFLQRFQKLLDYVVTKTLPEAELAAGFQKLQTTSLGFDQPDKEGRDARLDTVVRRLTSTGHIQRCVAVAAIEHALLYGSEDPSNQPNWSPTRDMLPVYRRRKLLDLFSALVRAARSLCLRRREKVEQVAYQMLVQELGV